MLSDDDLPRDAGDVRLVDRLILDELRKIEDPQPYLRGAIASMGFKQIGVPYDRDARVSGESKFKFGDMLRLALDGVLNHSVVPLRIASATGFVVALATFLLSISYLILRLFFGQHWPAGFTTTVILILLSLTLNALFLGIIGEYLDRIYIQIKKRQTIIIEKGLNFH